MYKVFLAVLLVIISNGANAEWTYAGGSSDDNLTVYVDLATIRKSGNIAKMWSMFDYKTIQGTGDGKQYLSVKRQDEYDCKEETFGLLTFTEFYENMGKGNPIYSNSAPANKSPIEPGSLGETKWKLACAK